MKIIHPQNFTRVTDKFISFILFSLLLLSNSNCYSTVITDLYITEIMANPSAVSDSNGEWFELYNPGNESFDFNGITLSDNGTDKHLISALQPLLIQPEEYFVFGRNGNSSQNGGYMADYTYSGFTLANAEDEIILTDLIGNALTLEYKKGHITSGQSLELISADMLIDNYSTATLTYGNGDYGTPGTKGIYEFTVTAVPEPATLWLFLTGITFLGYFSRKVST